MADLAQRELVRQDELFTGRASSRPAELDAARRRRVARRCAPPPSRMSPGQARIAVVGSARQRTCLVAPFDGTVAKIVGEVGEYSTPSPPGVPMPPAIDLIDETCLYVSAPMDEVDAPRFAPGRCASPLDALPGRPSPARCGASRRT